MTTQHPYLCWLFLSALLLGTLGCVSNPDEFQPVSGTVHFQGGPLSQGTIQFSRPEEPARRLAGALIKDGEFRVPADCGLKPGTYRVSISAPESPANPDLDNMVGGFPINRERIPAAFNTQSTLMVVVEAGGPNHFEFVVP